MLPVALHRGSTTAAASPWWRRCYGRACRAFGVKARVSLFLIAVPGSTVLYVTLLQPHVGALLHLFQSRPVTEAALLFYSIFATLVVALFPVAFIDLAAGFLFGLALGWPLALATKVSGSVLTLLLSRRFCSSYVQRTVVERVQWLAALDDLMLHQEYKTMMLLRFSALPAAVKNYSCGALSCSLWSFTLATSMSLGFESCLLVPAGQHLTDLSDIFLFKRGPLEWAITVFACAVLLALVILIKRAVRERIRETQVVWEQVKGHDQPPLEVDIEAEEEDREVEGVHHLERELTLNREYSGDGHHRHNGHGGVAVEGRGSPRVVVA